jgi:hypothetical protein
MPGVGEEYIVNAIYMPGVGGECIVNVISWMVLLENIHWLT